MSLKTDLQSDFDTIQSDFGVSCAFSGTTVTLTGVRNSMDKEVSYSSTSNKTLEYKFTVWFDVSDFTASSVTVPDVHDEITIGGATYLIVQRNYDPLEALVSFDMAEQYG